MSPERTVWVEVPASDVYTSGTWSFFTRDGRTYRVMAVQPTPPLTEAAVRAQVAAEFRELASVQKAKGEAGENLGQVWDGTRQSMELNRLADWIVREGGR